MPRVIVFGSLNMDLSIACGRMPHAGETISGSGFITNAGGKGANQAVAAARLGAETCMIGAVGADAFGNDLHRCLEAANVDTAELATIEETPTGVAVIIRTDGDNRIVLDPGANHVLRIADVETALERVAQPGDIFITQLECDVETTFAALAAAHERGLYTIFNPAPACEIPPETWRSVDLLCLNETECAAISGMLPVNEDTAAAAFKRLAALGVGRAIITRGEDGSNVYDAELSAHIPSLDVEAVDTTAAGDTYIGALAAALVAEKTLLDAASWASAAAALAVTRVGAQCSIPKKCEVDAL